MRAYVFTGGEIFPQYIKCSPEKGDLVVAADSGYKNAEKLGVKPSVVVGDFDSMPECEIPSDAQVIKLPCEKGVTDAQAAVQIALDEGARDIVVIGGLSGRLDHTISSFALTERLLSLGVRAVMTDGGSRVRFLRSSSELIGKSDFDYISVLAADEKVKGVTLHGCKYPLKNATLYRAHQFAVSNVITGNCALIEVKKGGVYVIESRNA